MRYPDLFALGVRLFGVWLVTQGATYFSAFADSKLYPSSERARDSATAYLIYVTVDFALAAFFLLWTRVIVGWCYGEDPGMTILSGADGGESTRSAAPGRES